MNETTSPGHDPPPRFPDPEDPIVDLGNRVSILSDAMLQPEGRFAQLTSKVDKALGMLDTLIRLVKSSVDKANENAEEIKHLKQRASRHSGLLAAIVPPELLASLEGNGAGNGHGD